MRRGGSGSSPRGRGSRGNLGGREPRLFLVSRGTGSHGQGCCKVSNEIRGVKHCKPSSAEAGDGLQSRLTHARYH